MKHRVSDLDGALLDAAVAKAEALHLVAETGAQFDASLRAARGLRASTDWQHGGPIIERERIDTRWRNDPDRWQATLGYGETFLQREGPTPLVAAMRAYVASKFGQEVELPMTERVHSILTSALDASRDRPAQSASS